MRQRRNSTRRGREAGFSMVELLMTAFVLAIGILGLTMLQIFSMKSSRGSRSLSTAIQVGEQVMDQAELEGRLSWLNITDTNNASPKQSDINGIKYINIAADGNLVETYNVKGGVTDAGSADPLEKASFYTVTTTRVPFAAVRTGLLSDITVQIRFVDDLGNAGAPIPRTVTLTRRILHG